MSHAVSQAAALAKGRGSSMLVANIIEALPGRRSMLHRPAVGTVLGMALGALACGAAQGQAAFPSKNVTLVVPFPAGGTADLLCRFAAVICAGGQMSTGASGSLGPKAGSLGPKACRLDSRSALRRRQFQCSFGANSIPGARAKQ